MKDFKIIFCLACCIIAAGCISTSHRPASSHMKDAENTTREYKSKDTDRQTTPSSISEDNKRGSNIVPMEIKDGAYWIPIKINGVDMTFIFDTGASDISISTTEANFLAKQGKLTEEDILSTQNYAIADGSMIQGLVINLKTVTIGNKTLNNVRANIIDSPVAPILLGQSALNKFGKYTIDVENSRIIFE